MAGPLIDPEELATVLGDVTILDVRWSLAGPSGRAEYDGGHLPGARFVDLDAELAGVPGARGRHPLPDRNAFVSAMRAHGVDPDRPVVVHDAADSTSAARAWWLLRHYGHPDVRVLDGGLAAWVRAGFALSTADEHVPPGRFDGTPGATAVVVADGVLPLGLAGTLIDARAAERFRGEVEPIDPVAGHVPGAVNLPTAQNVDETGRFRPAVELAERFAAIADGGPVAVYCGSGVTATHEILALELAGVEAALFPGSWSEWVGDPTRPVATGE